MANAATSGVLPRLGWFSVSRWSKASLSKALHNHVVGAVRGCDQLMNLMLGNAVVGHPFKCHVHYVLLARGFHLCVTS